MQKDTGTISLDGDIRQRKSSADAGETSARYSIAMVAACPFPANQGSAASIREMSDTLADMGHRVHIVTYNIGQTEIPVRRALVYRTGPFETRPSTRVGPSWRKLVRDFQLALLLIKVVQREGIDIIHAHNYEGALVGLVAKFITGRPLLYNAVNLMSDELAGYRFIRPAFLANAIARVLDRVTPIFPDHITAVSRELKQSLVSLGVPAAKIDIVPAGIEPPLFEQAEPEKFRSRYSLPGKRVVMYTGVLNAFQRIDYLLRAFTVVLREEPNTVLVVLSPNAANSMAEEHKKLAEELKISGAVIWIFSHALEDLPSFLALADVTIMSRADCPGHPIKLLNYMLAGKPIVCFAGAAKGVRHLHDAFVVRDHDFEGLGRGVVTLLRDAGLSCKLSRNARETVLAQFDWRQICRKIERIYVGLARHCDGAW